MKKSKSKQSFSLYYILIAAFFVFAGGWFMYRQIVKPVGINKIAIANPNGCYWKTPTVCKKEPCEPYLYCPSPSPVSGGVTTTCMQAQGTCQDSAGTCVEYTNSCEKTKLCGANLKQCAKPVLPPPTTVVAPPGCEVYYPPCAPPPSCAPGVPCAIPSCDPIIKCPSPSPSASPSPTPVTKILFFEATDPCGLDSFASISYDCTGKGMKSFTNGACTKVVDAMKAIQPICTGASK